MKSIIHSRLLSHFTENHIISDRQAAYMTGDSTTDQFLYIVPQIRSAWQMGNIWQAAFMDVDGAFENVWPSGLHAKLKQSCITENAFKLLESHLSNRH